MELLRFDLTFVHMHESLVLSVRPAKFHLPSVKPKTEELLYLLLWSCDLLRWPAWRNMSESFEGWAYRNGFHRQLARLERQHLIELRPDRPNACVSERVLRLTELGRLRGLGGRDPEARWQRPWDGCWRLVVYDLPAAEGTKRNRLRNHLRARGFGWLQKSVWISPDPVADEKAIFAGSKVDVESLILLEARPAAGETDDEIVAGAWDFDEINRRYARHLEVLDSRPAGPVRDETAAASFRQWARQEQEAWLAAVSSDPLLPERLHPTGYLGPKAWRSRVKTLGLAARQIGEFRG